MWLNKTCKLLSHSEQEYCWDSVFCLALFDVNVAINLVQNKKVSFRIFKSVLWSAVTNLLWCLPTEILCKPVVFFLRGKPIPKRMLPPEDLVRYYTDPRNRGYLADPAKVAEARLELAKKYGYVLPDITKDELFKMLSARKDPRQIFFGLAPGWIVNLADKKILKPTDESLLKYYSSWIQDWTQLQVYRKHLGMK